MEENQRKIAHLEVVKNDPLCCGEGGMDCFGRIRSVDEMIEDLKMEIGLIEREGCFSHAESFYRTTSDDLLGVEAIPVEGKNVATVASSGDFWQIFIAGGAQRVDIFDISLPALLYSEFKLAALETLAFGEYMQLLEKSFHRTSWAEPAKLFFDSEIYFQKIRAKLTPQARIFFDEVALLQAKESILRSFSMRCAFLREEKMFVGSVIRDSEQYAELQKKVRTAHVSFKLIDINKANTAFVRNEVVYLSNINYRLLDSLKLARSLTEKKTRVVVATNIRRVYELGEEVEGGDSVTAEKLNSGKDLGLFSKENVRLLFFGEEGDFNIMLEVSKK